MKDRKLISILKVLDENASKRLKKFLASPYHNASPKLRDLCSYYLKFYPDFALEAMSDEAAYKSLRTGKAFSAHELNRFSSKLYKLIETFLKIEGLEDSPLIGDYILLEQYAKAKSISQFQTGFSKLEKALSKPDIEKNISFFYEYLSTKLAHKFFSVNKTADKLSPLFSKSTKALDTYYMSELLQEAATLGYRDPENLPSAHMPLFDEVMQLLASSVDAYPLIIRAWYFANALMQAPDNINHFEALKNIVLHQVEALPVLDARNLSIILTSAIPYQYADSRQKAYEAYFAMYALDVDQGWAFADGTVLYQYLNNVITVALFLDKIAWAESFLAQCAPMLSENTRQDVILYNQARIAFEKGIYPETLKCLATVTFPSTRMGLAVKRLYLKAYFEMEDVDGFEQTLNNLRVFSYRADAADQRQKADHNHFSIITNALFRSKLLPIEKHALQELEAEITVHQKLPEYNWLIHKCKEQLG